MDFEQQEPKPIQSQLYNVSVDNADSTTPLSIGDGEPEQDQQAEAADEISIENGTFESIRTERFSSPRENGHRDTPDSSLGKDESKQVEFPPHEKKPGQPLYASRIESFEHLNEGDHILYQISQPPFRMMYRSAIIVKSHDEAGKVIVITNFPEGVKSKEIYFDQLKNVHKIEYDSCRFLADKSIERAKRRLKMNESCYHALFNNSHFFVSWCKTGREHPLTDILVDVSQDPNVTQDTNLTPVMYKRIAQSTKELHPGDHVMLRSKHYLIDSITGEKTFSVYTVNEENQVEWLEELKWSHMVQIFIIDCPQHQGAIDSDTALKQAAEELKRKSRWEGSDFFITAMKCGREHTINKDCIISHDITIEKCTRITPEIEVNKGDHLVFNDLKNITHSVLVTKCFDHTQVTVKPPVEEGEILDLTTYPEVFRVDYSHNLPAEETVIRGCCKHGTELIQKQSPDGHSMFVSWAKTGKGIPLPSDLIKTKFASESLQVTKDIQVGDHIVECTQSRRRHYMVTQKDSKHNTFTVIFCQAGGLVHEESIDFNCKELYRIVYLEGSLSCHDAIERAKSQVGEWKQSPWDQMLFIIRAKAGEDECSISVSNCKLVSLDDKLSKGSHLICKTSRNILHSFLVVNYTDHKRVEVKPCIGGSKEQDLTVYPEVYQIKYGDSSTPKQPTSPEELLSLPLQDFIKAKFALECVTTANDIQIGDHLIIIEYPSFKHIIISGHKKRSVYTVVFSCRDGDPKEEIMDMSNKQLYRVIHLQKSGQSVADLMKVAKSRVGQKKCIQWDQLLYSMESKSCKNPTSKCQINSLSQLQLGDYVISEPRIGHSHHYLIVFIAAPGICTAIEAHQGKIVQVNLTQPESGKYPMYYRVIYKPGICVPAKESVDLALSLVGKKFSRRDFIHFLKTNELEHPDLSQEHENPLSGSTSRSEITDFSQLQLGDYLVKEPVVGVSRHYIIVSIASTGNYTAVECFQGKLSKVILTLSHQEKHSKYYLVNYPSSVSVEESMKKALLLVDKNFVHFLKTYEEDSEIDEKSLELATAGAMHSIASPQYIEPIASINDLNAGDHIIYSTAKPPLRPVYCSGLVLAVATNGKKEIDVITLEREGCLQKQINVDIVMNLGKVVYQGCHFSDTNVTIRGRQALQFKDKEKFHEEFNNSHHFVTRMKAGRESSLSELLRIFVKTTKEEQKPIPLKPVLIKMPVTSMNEIKPGDHILWESEHCLCKSNNYNNAIEMYTLDDKKHVTCTKKKDLQEIKGVYRIDYDPMSPLYTAELSLKTAEEESKRDREWQRSDVFVTMTKCGSGFVVDDRCLMPSMIDTHCTEIVGNTSVDNGDHLLIGDEVTDGSEKMHSVLVYKFYHQTRIEVIPSLSLSHERSIIDLTKYSKKYRVNYSHSLPSHEINVRAESQIGKDLLQQCTTNDCSQFIYWTKTGQLIETLTQNVLLQKSRRLTIIRPISYDKVLSPDEIHVGDHLFWNKNMKSYRYHVMVTECNVNGEPLKFKLIYCSKSRFKEKVKTFGRNMGEDTYRINYPEALPEDLAIMRARSQLKELNFKPLARLWFVRWAKTGSDEGLEVGFLKNNTRPVTKSRILSFSQLNRGDYLVEEPKMNFYHHYIVLSVESPTQCTVVESWQHSIRRKVLMYDQIHDPLHRPWFYCINYEKGVCISPKVSVKKAKNLINTKHSNPFSNCFRENFVHYLKTDEAASIDTDELLDDRILLQRERVTSAMELMCGDHIERPLSLAPSRAQHHMLVVQPVDDEHCEVIHFKVHKNATKVLKFKKGDVTREVVNIFDQGHVSRIRYPERINPLSGMKKLSDISKGGALSKAGLKDITGMEEYHIKENNCEHLVTIATIGFPLSIQVHHVIHQALQCSKAVVRSCRASFISHAGGCSTGDAPLHAVCHMHAGFDIAVQHGCNGLAQHVGNTVASKAGVIATEVGAKAAAKSTVKSAAKAATKVTTKAATKATSKSATKASVKTTSKAAFEAGSEAAISGTILGAIGGIAFGVNVLLEAPFYIRGAYKLHRKKKFDMISKEEYQRQLIQISFTSANTVIGGTLGAVAGQAAIPVPVLGAVVGGFVGSLAGQACGYLEGKAVGCMIRDPTQVTLPVLHTPKFVVIKDLEDLKDLPKERAKEDHCEIESGTKQTVWHLT